MAQDNNKNEPAFPALDPNTAFYREGLTKREYFAAMALQGKLSGGEFHDNKKIEDFAKSAVEYADALLLELSK